MADGRPVPIKEAKYRLSINGVSGPGERVSFSPSVAPDGTFKQKLPDGIYHMPYGTLNVPFEGKGYTLNLDAGERVGDRESKDGIVHNFVWRLTGPRPDSSGNADVNNHTHWWGITVGASYRGYREDTKAPAKPPPAGTVLVFTLTPLSKLVDGSEAKTLTVERKWAADILNSLDALNDLPPANYELSGLAKLPDGATKRLLFMGKGDYPNFKPSCKIILEPDATMSSYFVPLINWVVDD